MLKERIATVWNAARRMRKDRRYLFLFLALSAFFSFLNFYLPVWAVPGNSAEFQIAITPWWGLLGFLALGILVGFLFTLQAYTFFELRNRSMKGSATASAGFGAGIMSGLFSSASCASCIGALFGFLGAGGILFLLEHRWEIVGVSLLLLAGGVYFSAVRIEKGCAACEARPAEKENGKG